MKTVENILEAINKLSIDDKIKIIQTVVDNTVKDFESDNGINIKSTLDEMSKDFKDKFSTLIKEQ